jgi:hypothetical protein
LSAHRWKSVLNLVIALLALAAVGAGVYFIVRSTGKPHAQVAQRPPADATAPVVKPPPPPPPPDASTEMSHDDIVALSKYGFFSITANAHTTIYIDGKNIGDTPLTRLPIKPGPHTVRAVGPHGRAKTMKIIIVGGRDTDQGAIHW